MARKDTAKAQQETTVEETALDTSGPTLADGRGQIIEEALGIRPETEIVSPTGDPGDLSASSGSALLRDLSSPGGEFGSSLLDDLAGDLPDLSDGLDGISDGSGTPVIDDQSGWAMDGTSGQMDGASDETPHATPADYFLLHAKGLEAAADAYATGETAAGDAIMAAATGAYRGGMEALADAAAEAEADEENLLYNVDEENQGGDDDDEERERQRGSSGDEDEDEGESQGGSSSGGDGPRGSQTMPAPDDGTGGEPDADDFIGGRGDVDPAPETKPAGDRGQLIGGRGDVDPAPETEDPGSGGGATIDMVSLGQGVIDPLEDKSTLIGDDTGDLAEMATEADLGDIEVEFDDSLVDADIGGDA